jgi:hypothetical protein
MIAALMLVLLFVLTIPAAACIFIVLYVVVRFVACGLNWLSCSVLDWLFESAPNDGNWTVDAPGLARRVR